MKKKLVVILAFVLVLSAIPVVLNNTVKASGATYYVAKRGNDSTGTGSYATPWATIQRGINGTGGGDTLIVQNGDYNQKLIIRGDKNGTSGAWTIIRSENRSGATINGNSFIMNATSECIVWLKNVSYLRFTGFQIKNSTRKAVSIFGWSCNHIRIDNNSVYNTTFGAFTTIRNTDDSTMTKMVQNVTIENNTCTYICNGYSGVAIGEGIEIGESSHNVAQYNYIKKCGKECINAK